MRTTVKILVNTFLKRPRLLFLIDASGALLTAFMLFVVLKNFNVYFGMPPSVLNGLALIALLFGIYSLLCSMLLKKNWAIFMSIISIANLLYCLLSLVLLIIHYASLTPLGLIYFLGEITIISCLASVEYYVIKAARSKT